MSTWFRRAGQGIAGLGVGLLLTEVASSVRDDGAFPHVNFYVADADLGVRLQPDAQERIAFGGNPTTTIATHALGYRTPVWPQTGENEILVVGDSQVFGLGVEADGTLAAHLARETGRTVLNGGVPTYGPAEYLAAAEEIILMRGGAVRDLVVVLNFSNDLFEVERPNRERHAVWDGWAVRIETAPEQVSSFPGRRWLFSKSHAVFALRAWLHAPVPGAALGVPSEGTLTDVVATAQTVHQAREATTGQVEQQRIAQAQAYTEAARKVDVEDELLEILGELGYSSNAAGADYAAVRAIQRRASVGDIVEVGYGEASREITVTADMLRQGAQIRRNLRARVERHIGTLDPAHARSMREQLPEAQAIPAELLTEDLKAVLWGTPFDDLITQAVALGDAHDVAVTIVTLPLDVQVLESQWAKYGAEPQDMSGSEILLDDVVAAAKERGARAVNPLLAIRAVGDAAFLQGDLHLTSAGHAAVAAQVAATLAEPLLRIPGPGIHPGRSRVPLLDEFIAAGENNVRGSTRNRCATHAVREWFYMDCTPARGDRVTGVHLGDAPLETFGQLHERDGRLRLWMPLLPGREARVDVLWEQRQEQLQLTWTADQTPALAFAALEARPTPDEPFPLYIGGGPGTPRGIGAISSCLLEGGSTAYRCLEGSRLDQVPCAVGKANAGSADHCFPLCSPELPCAAGVCSDWNGGRVCL